MAASILIVGASGYVGSCLADRFRSEGVSVRLASRRVAALAERFPGSDVVAVDVLDPPSIVPALEGIRVVYYLVHSMGDEGSGFEERDRQAAANLADAAGTAGVDRIVYLGGLGDPADALSHHLASRQETGRVLAGSEPAVVEFRAGIIIGSGSVSYRMLGDLVKRLPVMVTPRWVETRAQPIGIDDVVSYLVAAASVHTGEHHRIIEIGGAEVWSYRELMRRYASLQHRRPPTIVSVPVLTPRLSSLWCGLVTSVPASVARPLIEGLRNEVVVRDSSARELFSDIVPIGFDEAVGIPGRMGTPGAV